MTHTRTCAVTAAIAFFCAAFGYGQPTSQSQGRDSFATTAAKDTAVPQALAATPAPQETRRNVAILPIEVVNADTNLAGLFGDIAARAMDETGSFLLVDRQNITKILLEQSLAASGAVSDSSATALGKLAGASHIARIRMSSLGKGRWAGSATMTDVQSGTLVVSAEEQREGDGLEVGRRILRNLAFSLAGKPTEDHLRYEAEQRRIAMEKVALDKTRERRWKVGAGIGLGRRLHILLPDDIGPRRAYYSSRPDIVEWSLPDESFCPVFELDAAWRASRSLWLWVRGEGLMGPGQPWRARTITAFDTLFDAGGVASRIESHQTIVSEGSSHQDRASLSAGVEWVFLEKAPFRFSVLGGLSGDWTRLAVETRDSSASEASMFLNGMWSGNQWLVTQSTSSSTLTGWGLGGRLGLRAEWEFIDSWSLGAEATLAVARMGEITGTTNSTRADWSHSTMEPTLVRRDSSWSEPAALLVGNHLGTGDYRMVGNPDVRSKNPSGQLVTTSKATSEVSDVHLTLRIARYF
jgi:hypothetical protein